MSVLLDRAERLARKLEQGWIQLTSLGTMRAPFDTVFFYNSNTNHDGRLCIEDSFDYRCRNYSGSDLEYGEKACANPFPSTV